MIGNKSSIPEAPIGGLHNTLSSGASVKGEISLETDFRLDGQIFGNVKCKSKIVIGPKGYVEGNIEAASVEVTGVVKGDIKVKEKLVVKASAKIDGNIFTRSLEVEPNAKINGTCSMDFKEESGGILKHT